ncbi:MAG: DAK2 domain-containing protein [Acidimicrobiia bacterium]
MTFTSADLKRAMAVYQRLLKSYRNAINGLNVYPVPDGDTGSNMAQTIDSVMRHLEGAETMAEVATALGHGSLVGAAGNSGVILAQVLRGIADAVRSLSEVDASDMAAALEAAATSAYKVVERPVEGTILTVVRESASAASDEASRSGVDLAALLDASYHRAAEALERTPEMLPVLRDAGVVDAGGAGYLLLLAAFLEVASGVETPLPERLLMAIPLIEVEGTHGGPRYEVMYFLEALDEKLDDFRDVWSELGDSIVVVGGEGLWNCHIHTDDIGSAVEAGIEAGRPRGIRITDLHEQIGALEADVAAGGFSPLPAFFDAAIGVVAVATGPGLVERFRRLGVQQVVAGGQSANPPVEDVLAAVEEAPASTIVILPNNKNIIPVAEQVDGLTTKTVAVVPTRSLTQGLAAMMGYVPEAADLDSLLDDMAAAAGAVDFGEVTIAVRDARVDGWEVSRGDWIGVADGRIVVAARDRFSVLRGLVAEIMPSTAELVTVYTGEGASRSDTKALEAWVGETHPAVEVLALEGGQPVYPYLISVE